VISAVFVITALIGNVIADKPPQRYWRGTVEDVPLRPSQSRPVAQNVATAPRFGYTASRNVLKVHKKVNTAEAPVSSSMLVADDPDAVLDDGILVSRKSIHQILAEEDAREKQARTGQGRVSRMGLLPIRQQVPVAAATNAQGVHIAKPYDLQHAAGHHHGHGHGHGGHGHGHGYYQYARVPHYGAWEFGYRRGTA